MRARRIVDLARCRACNYAWVTWRWAEASFAKYSLRPATTRVFSSDWVRSNFAVLTSCERSSDPNFALFGKAGGRDRA